ncbi:fatty acid desaturase [Solimonas sp. C16B3]|uniref:Fatty acid desaturase n=1 Tax=Solimonas marina TaxID=2714601 RepID=A0A969W9P5_9GAMM|nr:fatty acid desaturase [Solimonas marina]NKF22090.1 fatty acid desaturase [Solimonas marina]
MTSAVTDAERVATIKAAIRAESERVRARWGFLRHQDAIGAAIMALSVAGMIASGWAYAAGAIPWWVCIPMSAIFASFIHELEHDLIHTLYFRKNPIAYHLMMALCWITRPSTVSPWVRRRLHLHHHKYSGTESDLEERAITNGERWGLRRLLMTGDHMLAVLLRQRMMHDTVKAFIKAQQPTSREEVQMLIKEQRRGFVPLSLLHYAIWYGFLGYHAVALGFAAAGTPLATSAFMNVIDTIVVVWLAPNVLRVFCLHFVSSNMHYYGDIDTNNIVQQCQVLNPWWLWPAQLFCFNFGATHAIHHFVVNQPFYVRQLTARAAHRVMRDNGVRFNDYGVFGRANRWGALEAATPKTATA